MTGLDHPGHWALSQWHEALGVSEKSEGIFHVVESWTVGARGQMVAANFQRWSSIISSLLGSMCRSLHREVELIFYTLESGLTLCQVLTKRMQQKCHASAWAQAQALWALTGFTFCLLEFQTHGEVIQKKQGTLWPWLSSSQEPCELANLYSSAAKYPRVVALATITWNRSKPLS